MINSLGSHNEVTCQAELKYDVIAAVGAIGATLLGTKISMKISKVNIKSI